MIQTLPELLFHQGLCFPATNAQLYKDSTGTFQPVTYHELCEDMFNFAAGLVTIGTKRGEHIGHIADNRKEWQVISLGAMVIGCADIPRGSDVTVKELTYILSFTECRTVSVENPYVLGKLCECLDEIPTLKNIILIDSQNKATDRFDLKGRKLIHYENFLKTGFEWRQQHPEKIKGEIWKGKTEDVATIIFTSGTTGTPKGVQLTHKNFLCQLDNMHKRLDFHRGDRAMCILPIWHVYQRLFELYIIYFAGCLCYSRPIPSILMSDFPKVRPQFMPCVPRVWDSIYQIITKKLKAQNKISWMFFNILKESSASLNNMYDIMHGLKKSFRKTSLFKQGLSKLLIIPYGILYPLRLLGEKLYFKDIKEMIGGRFITGVSGGGGLPPKLDKFFNAVGIHIIEAYGMTETAPLVSIRNRFRPVSGTIGKPLEHNECKILNSEGKETKPGEKGVLYVKGQNVMAGYYQRPDLTDGILTNDGWLNTGDIACKTYEGELIIKGRQKDTIVLRSGENVEPFPIEAKLVESPYITKAVVCGQDQNYLGAIIIANTEALKQAAEHENQETKSSVSKLLSSDFAKEIVTREIERLICSKNGFKNFERVSTFILMEKFLHPEEEFSAKGDIIRYKILQNYKHQINSMFQKEEKKQKKLMSEKLQELIPEKLQEAMQEWLQNFQN
ncbi:MAG: AMP-binding protein [Treponema sp.]|nr:AMP-binding protein [Treponema sp.]